MKTHLMIRRTAFALILFPVAACAQPTSQQATSPRKPSAASGGVTLQQYMQRHERKLMADDTDGDGKISRAEFIAAANAGKGDQAKRFAKVDRNGDGMLDKGEIDARLTRRFTRLDTNGDSVLSPDERASAHHKKGAAGDGANS